MALLMLGCLMVLNTTYFMSQEKTGDAFHFFKLHLLHLVRRPRDADGAFAVLLARPAAPGGSTHRHLGR